MRNKSGLFKLLVFITAGLTFCSEPDYPVTDILPVTVSVVFPPKLPSADTTQAWVPSETNTGGDNLNALTARAYLNPDLTYDSINDIEGNVYMTIRIGSLNWMAENLKTTRFNDSSMIPYVTDNSLWTSLKTGAYRWYNNDRPGYRNLYGALYNWYTVKTGRLCPAGWHVPSDDDWKELEMALGMTRQEADSWGEFPGLIGRGTDQALQMKTNERWVQWEGRGGGGTNSSGFSALPAGESAWGGTWPSSLYSFFSGEGLCTTWWDSTNEGGGRALVSSDPGVVRGIYPAFCGLSVRCVKDKAVEGK